MKIRIFKKRFDVLLAVLGLILASIFVATPAQADSTLCSNASFNVCINAGYTAHGYDSRYTNSYWRAAPGHNCTNYVGYMLSLNGDSGPGVLMGDAGYWDDTIKKNKSWGYVIDSSPTKGSIAQWEPNANSYISSSGHVAYVESVNADGSITVSEDNYSAGPYTWLVISKNSSRWPSQFLHIRDVSPSSSISVGASRASVTAAKNADGRLQFFAVGGDGNIYTMAQSSAGNSFSGSYSGLPASVKDLASVVSADGRIELFYINSDGSVRHRAQTALNSSFGNEDNFGGTVGSAITVAKNADGRLQFFAVGGDGNIYTMAQSTANGSFSGTYSQISANGAKDVTTVVSSDGRIELLYVAADGSLRHRAQTAPNSSFGPELNLGGGIAGPLTAQRNADGRLEVYALGTDGNIYAKSQVSSNGSFGSTWTVIAASARDVASAVNTDGRIELFYVHSDGSVRGRAQVSVNSSFGA